MQIPREKHSLRTSLTAVVLEWESMSGLGLGALLWKCWLAVGPPAQEMKKILPPSVLLCQSSISLTANSKTGMGASLPGVLCPHRTDAEGAPSGTPPPGFPQRPEPRRVGFCSVGWFLPALGETGQTQFPSESFQPLCSQADSPNFASLHNSLQRCCALHLDHLRKFLLTGGNRLVVRKLLPQKNSCRCGSERKVH